VKLKSSDGTTIAIDTISAENKVAENMYQRSKLDHLIYNDPITYANLKAYLKAATEYKSLDQEHNVPTDFLRVLCRYESPQKSKNAIWCITLTKRLIYAIITLNQCKEVAK